MKTRVSMLLLLALTGLFLPCLAVAAAPEEPTIYVVKKGDTLWGLSERFLKDPYYWPNMWSKNSQVTNPHFIYPGQMVRVFPDRLELVPRKAPVTQKAAVQAAPAQEVAEEKSFSVRGNEGFLMEKDSKPFGTIIGIHNERIIAGSDDIVYTDIGTNRGIRGGEKFSIFSAEGSVSHPLTNVIMGRKIIPLGTLQLTEVERTSSRAIITGNYKEIGPGAYLIPYRDDRRREVTLKMANRELKGYIIESHSGTNIIAAGDIAYIDLGSDHGAEPGNLLYVVRDVPIDQMYAEGRVERLPQELMGALVILETGKSTATALVVKSIDAIYKGDKIVSHTK